MSSRSHSIIDLKEKLALLLRNKVSGIKTQTELAKESGIDNSLINRWLNPTNVGLHDFEKLCEVHKDAVPLELWDKPIEEFAETLGLAYEAPQRTVSSPAVLAEKMGIDFESRRKERKFLEKRFEIMKGYWEVIRYSISITTNQYIIYALLEIEKLSPSGYAECTLVEKDFSYKGSYFLVSNVTYFLMEEINVQNEIMWFSTNSPDRMKNPILHGICSALTGGSQELIAIPASVKVVLRHVGSLDAIKEKYKLNNALTSVTEIITSVRNIINADNSQIEDILPLIDNHIPQDAVPYALRAKLF